MTEWNAVEYDRRAGLQRKMADQVLALLKLKGSERVLDIGCGDGKVSAQIASLVPNGSVVGVDASADMIAFASQRVTAATPNLRFEVADARRLPFHSEFDVVVSFNALHWVPDQENALRSIRMALKPEGYAQLRLVPLGQRKSLETVLEETRKSPRWLPYFDGFHDPYLRMTPEQYVVAAEREGLQVRSHHTALESWNFETHEAFSAFGTVTFVEWTRRIPDAQKQFFVSDVLDRYRVAGGNADGEENVFKFYQMDIQLVPSSDRPSQS